MFIDRKNADVVREKRQRLFFIFASSNLAQTWAKRQWRETFFLDDKSRR